MKVLLIDDDAELGAMLGEYLAAEGFETAQILNGEDGVAAALSGEHDVVVLDVMLPRLNGVEALRRIRQASDVPVIMLTARGDDVDRVVGLEMGADDYVPKPAYPRELVARLRAIHRRTSAAPRGAREPDTLSLGALVLHRKQRRALWGEAALDLTATEFNLLDVLLRSPEAVVSKDALSEQALGRAREAYDRSVDVHISNLRQKLQAATGGRVQVETVRAIGYALRAGT